ncbi:CLAVATA3/ESR (CLE)-related protein 43, partial [Cucurbita argyrosperma subsp. argyrosperma]
MCTRRIATSSSSSFALLIFILWVSQIWVCSHCQARASRIFPPPPPHTADTTLTGDQKYNANANAERELLRKYFKGKAFDRHRRDEGFEDSKRRIPSCPDPLHN